MSKNSKITENEWAEKSIRVGWTLCHTTLKERNEQLHKTDKIKDMEDMEGREALREVAEKG